MATSTSSWYNLLNTVWNADNKDFIPDIQYITSHTMYKWVKVPILYSELYNASPKTKEHQLIYMYKRVTLDRIKSMLDAMEKGI